MTVSVKSWLALSASVTLWLPLAALFLYCARWASLRDEQLYDIYSRYVKEGDAWYPWSTRGARAHRPIGYGKNLPC